MTLTILRYAAHPSLIRRSGSNRSEISKDLTLRLYKVENGDELDELQITTVETTIINSVEYTRRYVIMGTGRTLTDFIIIPLDALTQVQNEQLKKVDGV